MLKICFLSIVNAQDLFSWNKLGYTSTAAFKGKTKNQLKKKPQTQPSISLATNTSVTEQGLIDNLNHQQSANTQYCRIWTRRQLREVCAPLHPPSTNPIAPRQSKLALRQDQLAQAALHGEACTLFLKASRSRTPPLITALLFQRLGSPLIPHTQPLCPALSLHRRGRRGEHAPFQLFPSPCSGRAAERREVQD